MFGYLGVKKAAFLQYSLFGVPRHRRKKVSSGRSGERDVAEGGFIGYNSAVQCD